MATGAVSAAPVLDYTGAERQGETKQKKPEKRITAYWRRNTKKKQRNGAKAEPTESPARNHGSLSIQRSGSRNVKRTDRSRTERPPAKRTGKIKDKEVHKIASAAIGKTGAAIAHQATTFNYLTHEQYEQYLDDMKNAKTEEDKARMKDRWLEIDAEQNEEWLRKQGTGTYIDLSTIKKGDLPGQVIIEKRNGYKEALKKESIGDGNGHSSGMIPLALRSAAMAVITNEVGRPWKELEKTGVRGSLRIIGKYNAIGMTIDGAIDLTSDFNTYSGSNLKWALTIDGVKTLIGLGMSVTPIPEVISGPILDGGAYQLKEALLSRDMTKEKTN